LAGEPANPNQIVAEPLRSLSTPGASTIDALAGMLKDENVTSQQLVKSIAVFDENNAPVVILLPGDREARVPAKWRLFDEDDFKAHPNITKGFLGPVGLEGARVVADESLRYINDWFVTGANKVDEHHLNVVMGRDFTPESFGSYVVVETGDLCPNCAEPMTLQRSVEAAHTFQLGLRYSEVMNNATFLDEEGNAQPYWMGCYGLGVSRLFAVLAEEHHDDNGLIWPASVAPFDVVLVALSNARSPGVGEASDLAYEALKNAGVDVLYDDRDVSPGVKFADADLIGIPLRVTVGAKGLDRGIVEVRDRASGAVTELPLAALLAGQLSE
jgi:prolyl-tRNA synthetase